MISAFLGPILERKHRLGATTEDNMTHVRDCQIATALFALHETERVPTACRAVGANRNPTNEIENERSAPN